MASAPIVRRGTPPSLATIVAARELARQLSAVSLASAPELQKKTCPYPPGAHHHMPAYLARPSLYTMLLSRR